MESKIGLNWNNLIKNKCPQCNRGFVPKHFMVKQGMVVHPCGFEITEQKYKKLMSDIVDQRIQ